MQDGIAACAMRLPGSPMRRRKWRHLLGGRERVEPAFENGAITSYPKGFERRKSYLDFR